MTHTTKNKNSMKASSLLEDIMCGSSSDVRGPLTFDLCPGAFPNMRVPGLTVVALRAGPAPVAPPPLRRVRVPLDHRGDEPRVADWRRNTENTDVICSSRGAGRRHLKSSSSHAVHSLMPRSSWLSSSRSSLSLSRLDIRTDISGGDGERRRSYGGSLERRRVEDQKTDSTSSS